MTSLLLKLSGKRHNLSVLSRFADTVSKTPISRSFHEEKRRFSSHPYATEHMHGSFVPMGSLKFHPTLNCCNYKMASTCFFLPILPSLNPVQFPLCANNSSNCDMHIFRVLPVLSLLLGARASPVDSGDEVSRRLHARAAPSDVCLPVSPAGVAAGVDSQTCGSTFSSYIHARMCF